MCLDLPHAHTHTDTHCCCLQLAKQNGRDRGRDTDTGSERESGRDFALMGRARWVVHLHSRSVFIGWIQGKGSIFVCNAGGAACLGVLNPVRRIKKQNRSTVITE